MQADRSRKNNLITRESPKHNCKGMIWLQPAGKSTNITSTKLESN